MAIHVFYRDNHDGRCSAAIIRYFLQGQPIVFHKYGYDIPAGIFFSAIKKNDIVWMAGLLFKPKDMIMLHSICKEVIWIDHHDTAVRWARSPKAHGLFEGIQESDLGSTASLTWNYCFLEEEPRAVKYISLHDTWEHNHDQNILNFITGSQVYDLQPESPIWEAWLKGKNIDETIKYGITINKYLKKSNAEQVIKWGYPLDFMGYRAFACNNIQGPTAFSTVADMGYKFFISYFHNGEYFIVSLYANDGEKNMPDLSVIAQKFGGGGCPEAAEFVCESLPFER